LRSLEDRSLTPRYPGFWGQDRSARLCFDYLRGQRGHVNPWSTGHDRARARSARSRSRPAGRRPALPARCRLVGCRGGARPNPLRLPLGGHSVSGLLPAALGSPPASWMLAGRQFRIHHDERLRPAPVDYPLRGRCDQQVSRCATIRGALVRAVLGEPPLHCATASNWSPQQARLRHVAASRAVFRAAISGCASSPRGRWRDGPPGTGAGTLGANRTFSREFAS
jgi:hypothetical protein